MDPQKTKNFEEIEEQELSKAEVVELKEVNDKDVTSSTSASERSAAASATVVSRRKWMKELSEMYSSSTTNQVQPSTSNQVQPSTSNQVQPSTSNQVQPSTSNQVQPSTSNQVQPSTSNQVQPSTSRQFRQFTTSSTSYLANRRQTAAASHNPNQFLPGASYGQASSSTYSYLPSSKDSKPKANPARASNAQPAKTFSYLDNIKANNTKYKSNQKSHQFLQGESFGQSATPTRTYLTDKATKPKDNGILESKTTSASSKIDPEIDELFEKLDGIELNAAEVTQLEELLNDGDMSTEVPVSPAAVAEESDNDDDEDATHRLPATEPWQEGYISPAAAADNNDDEDDDGAESDGQSVTSANDHADVSAPSHGQSTSKPFTYMTANQYTQPKSTGVSKHTSAHQFLPTGNSKPLTFSRKSSSTTTKPKSTVV